MQVLPGPGRLGQPVGVDLADRDHHLALVVVDRVAVDVDVGEVVVLGDGLEVADARPQHLGVPQPDVVDRRLVGPEILLGEVVLGRELLGVDGVQVERLAGGVDVAGDVVPLAGQLLGLDPEPLEHRRDDAAHDQRHPGQQHDADQGDEQPAPPRPPEEHHGADQGDPEQHLEGWQLGLDVGVGGPGDHPAGREQQLVLVQPVAPGLEGDDEAEQHAQVRLGLGGDAVGLGLGADPAEHVVAGRDQQGGQDQGGEQPAEHRPLERQLEHVEADVAAEQGVALTEGDAVAPEQEGLPEAGRLKADDQPQEGGDAKAQGPQIRREDGPGPLDLGAGDHREPVARGQPLDHPQVDPDDGRRPQPGQHADDGLGPEHAPEQARLVDLPEPQEVGVEARDAADRGQGEERQQKDGQRPATGRTAGCDHVNGPFCGRRERRLRCLRSDPSTGVPAGRVGLKATLPVPIGGGHAPATSKAPPLLAAGPVRPVPRRGRRPAPGANPDRSRGWLREDRSPPWSVASSRARWRRPWGRAGSAGRRRPSTP